MTADRATQERPTLRAASLREALSTGVLASLTSEQLARFLMGRRWFGAKAGAPREVRFRGVVPLPWEDGAFALSRLEVTLGSGANALYSLPLAVRAVDESARAPSAALASVSTPTGDALLFDAVEDAAFRRGIADCFMRGASFDANGVRWTIESLAAKSVVLPPNAEVRLGSAEQSNTSLILDQEAILKLFRRLERGEHPDVEITRFLTLEAGFGHTPALLGMVRVEDAQGAAVAGMLQEFLPRSKDAWAFALSRAHPYFDAPRGEERPNDFLVEAGRLGAVTREMHDALATGRTEAFAAERATVADVERWANRTKQWIRDGLALLEKQLQAKRLPRERMGEAQALAGRRDHFLSRVDDVVDTVGDDAGERIRVHGDYHLGQVLRTASDDFMIIDFEGEPARSLAERREKASPLRDVAGMLRSFAYAAATLGMEAKSLDMGTRELRIGRWERDVRGAFLDAYLSLPGVGTRKGRRTGMLPSTDAHTRALLSLFETEKAFYELVYELNNRPDWVWIPMRGIAKQL